MNGTNRTKTSACSTSITIVISLLGRSITPLTFPRQVLLFRKKTRSLVLFSKRANRNEFLPTRRKGVLVLFDFLNTLLNVRQVGHHAILVVDVWAAFVFAPHHRFSRLHVFETNDAVSTNKIIVVK